MSERLIVEFYSASQASIPLATVLAFHGGENPQSAALTIVDFFSRISSFADPRLDNAGMLAARFISWMGAMSGGPEDLNFSDVTLVHHAGESAGQLVRIFAGRVRPYVQIIEDEYSTADELHDAAEVLSLYGLLNVP